jgi:hypothetical protein
MRSVAKQTTAAAVIHHGRAVDTVLVIEVLASYFVAAPRSTPTIA